jgi:hypothetical protein
MALFSQKNVLVFLRLFDSFLKKKELCRRKCFNKNSRSFFSLSFFSKKSVRKKRRKKGTIAFVVEK